jgi:hypothetical protein
MAKRRMISVDILETDKFYRLTPSSQCLYVHMILNADDDGFVDNVESLIRVVGVERKYYRELVSREYLIEFESGVAVITHWKKMNKIRVDRYVPTDYTEELRMLTLDEKDRYIKA